MGSCSRLCTPGKAKIVGWSGGGGGYWRVRLKRAGGDWVRGQVVGASHVFLFFSIRVCSIPLRASGFP